jgi:transcriptional regulator with XRE-family HTH domain
LTQEKLAALSGLNVITISRLEKGTAKEAYADTVAALARALGVSADYLLGLSDEVKTYA